MRFNNLSHDDKHEVQKTVLKCVKAVGGRNHFLSMIESIKDHDKHPLLNKTGKFHFKHGTITWGKEIFKDKIKSIKEMISQHFDTNLLTIKKEKLNKEIKNCIKTMGKLEFVIETKDGGEFKFTPFVTISEKNVEINPLFQIIFFDGIHNTKKIIDYK